MKFLFSNGLDPNVEYKDGRYNLSTLPVLHCTYMYMYMYMYVCMQYYVTKNNHVGINDEHNYVRMVRTPF